MCMNFIWVMSLTHIRTASVTKLHSASLHSVQISLSSPINGRTQACSIKLLMPYIASPFPSRSDIYIIILRSCSQILHQGPNLYFTLKPAHRRNAFVFTVSSWLHKAYVHLPLLYRPVLALPRRCTWRLTCISFVSLDLRVLPQLHKPWGLDIKNSSHGEHQQCIEDREHDRILEDPSAFPVIYSITHKTLRTRIMPLVRYRTTRCFCHGIEVGSLRLYGYGTRRGTDCVYDAAVAPNTRRRPDDQESPSASQETGPC